MLSGKHCAMPIGPKGQKRPADVASNAVRIMQIATGQSDEVPAKNAAAVTLGKMGGDARAAALSARARKAIAKKGASERWKNNKK
jgi:hypothetical protein